MGILEVYLGSLAAFGTIMLGKYFLSKYKFKIQFIKDE